MDNCHVSEFHNYESFSLQTLFVREEKSGLIPYTLHGCVYTCQLFGGLVEVAAVIHCTQLTVYITHLV